MIDVHFTPTPNGQKISIALEAVAPPYRLINFDIFEGDQHTAAFGRINPNHKLPAIVDHNPLFGGGAHAVFESGAILQYVAQKSGRLPPEDPRQRSVAIQWLTWQMAGLGPMGGQAAHFLRYAPERIDYAVDRYTREVSRLMRVLERRLGEAEYLAGETYSIADIAVWPGLAMAPNLAALPNIARWVAQIAERPGVIRGRAAERQPPAEWSNMFGERMIGAVDL